MKTQHALTHLVGNRAVSAPEGVVPLAARTARITTLQELEHPTLLQGLYEARNRLSRTRDNLLPLEDDLRSRLNGKLIRVEHEISRLEHFPTVGLPTLHPSFLSWKTVEGFPAFSVFTLDNPVCTVSYRRLSRMTGEAHLFVDPTIPEFMMEQFADEALIEGFEEKCVHERLSGISISARYGGAMPETVRETIHRSLNDSAVPFEEIFIIAEAPGGLWEVARIPEKDPLVVGVAFGLLWLIAAFDLTPSELFARELCLNTERVPLN